MPMTPPAGVRSTSRGPCR